MKRGLGICLLITLWVSIEWSSVWAVDVGWMQKGIRVWYFGGVGSTSSSDAEESYLFKVVEGNNVKVTKHSGMNHWMTTHPIETSTYSFLDRGPCWIHPQVLQNIEPGDSWMGFEISTIVRNTYTYDTFPYNLLPARALFAIKPQRQFVKIHYFIDNFSTGDAYFDADTGLCLMYSQLNGYVTVFFILSEINYDFEKQIGFAEDNGPHTGFKSFVSESQSTPSGANFVLIQSSVESRYGSTIKMWSTTAYNSFLQPDFEYYCFFGTVPVLRRTYMTGASAYPEQWNEYGQYLWWWVPNEALQKSTINVFGVPMTRISTDPYIFIATQAPSTFFFSKLWFNSDGYMIAFSAKDTATKLDIDPEYPAIYYQNLTAVSGLDYYLSYMEKAIPDFDRDQDDLPDAWEIAHGLNPLVNDANLDKDGDGFTNIQEFNAGTNPNDPKSYPGKTKPMSWMPLLLE